jgi:Peptidase family M1 domain/Carboxypeptidase regulatory-like domain
MKQTDETRLAHRTTQSFIRARISRRFSAPHFPGFVRSFFLVLLSLALATNVSADTISGTVKDPSGAIIVGARVEISGGSLAQPVVLASDDAGKFTAPNLTPGKYSVRVSKDGFDELVTPVELHGTSDLPLSLTIAPKQTSVTVSEKSTAFANSDPIYHQLRDLGLGDTYRCENFTLVQDVGTFELKSGTITFLGLVNSFETGAIFIGQGRFTLKPVLALDGRELTRRSGSSTVEEDLTEVVFRFSGVHYPEFIGAMGVKTDTPPEAAAAFQRWKEKVRHRHEIPQGFTQAMLEGDTIDNVDADVLATIYNPKHPPFFNAYMHGTPHKDLRFFVRTRGGAVPDLYTAEEVALINYNGDAMDDGVWYSQHLVTEIKARTANSREEKRLFATKKYNIETVIGKNDHLHSRATITFTPLVEGERVMKFGLLPNLRVTRVTDQNGQDLHFIQENRKEDGSFYAILDEAPAMEQEHSISVEYAGDKVLENAGDGSYYVGARESWYPNLNGFGEKALYDLTFKVPHSNVVISVGNLAGQSEEAGFAVSHWVTPVPVAVAGFNYGQYKKIDYPDTITHYDLAGYYLTELPSSLQPYRESAFLSAMSPAAMTKYALDQTRAQMQLCTYYFGRGPYNNVDVTEQPNFNFGQSWPTLVYLPISAYIDSTQRWMLFGQIDNKFTGFVREVTPHEVAHQWFGHGVVWASYHDVWLSEGFAEFAAGLFLQQAVGPKWQKDYIDFWERQRVRVLEKNNFGISPNDAGPLSLGIRLISPRSEQAYQGVIYSKGAYVLSMLRSIMYDDQAATGHHEQAFMDMMHDFMETHHDAPASTESFKAVAEKHMNKQLDLQQNGRLDWFFSEWVYGTEVPHYDFKYDVLEAEGGKIKVRAVITQSDVNDRFAMFVPVFADFGSGMLRLGQVAIAGNSTRTVDFILDAKPKKVAINAYKDVLER